VLVLVVDLFVALAREKHGPTAPHAASLDFGLVASHDPVGFSELAPASLSSRGVVGVTISIYYVLARPCCKARAPDMHVGVAATLHGYTHGASIPFKQRTCHLNFMTGPKNGFRV